MRSANYMPLWIRLRASFAKAFPIVFWAVLLIGVLSPFWAHAAEVKKVVPHVAIPAPVVHENTQASPGVTPDEAINIRVYKNANRAVVNIANISGVDDGYSILPRSGCGSGTIISADGFILTNFHVIDGDEALRVTLYDGSVLPTSVVGTDQS